LATILLLVGAQLILPGWLTMFVEGIGQYHRYTQNQSVLTSLFGVIAGWVLAAVCVLACALCLWKLRGESASTVAFGRGIGLVLALTVVIAPMTAPYNQVLLAPAILTLLRGESSGERVLPAVRRARIVGYFLLAWPWIATLGLTLAYVWLTPGLRDRVWPIPLYTSLMVPLFVFGLALLDAWSSEPLGLPESATAE
jgi:hypothetical protein